MYKKQMGNVNSSITTPFRNILLIMVISSELAQVITHLVLLNFITV